MAMAAPLLSADALRALVETQLLFTLDYSDTDMLLVRLLEAAMKFAPASSASLLLPHTEGSGLYTAAAVGADGGTEGSFSADAPSALWAWEQGRTLIYTEYASRALVPLRSGKPLGLLVLERAQGDAPFSEQDTQALDVFSVQAGRALQNGMNFLRLKRENMALRQALSSGGSSPAFIAAGAASRELLALVSKVAATDAPAALFGESGTGKSILARRIHMHSPRSTGPFIRVNCTEASQAVLESFIFDREEGALSAARGGSLFLDEVGSLPADIQGRLLDFIKNGSSELEAKTVRIIVSASRPLEELVHQGSFSSELYYRLNVFPILVPPLRRRRDEIEPLARFFCGEYAFALKKPFTGFSPEAAASLNAYYWPGNVRELKNAVERACILGLPPLIQPEDLGLSLRMGETALSSLHAAVAAAGEAASDKSLRTAVHGFKRAYVMKILEETAGNQTAAGRVLGIQRTYLSRLLHELHIR